MVRQALKHHPDKHADGSEEEREEAEKMFQQVNLANMLLSDIVKRRQYDAGGRACAPPTNEWPVEVFVVVVAAAACR